MKYIVIELTILLWADHPAHLSILFHGWSWKSITGSTDVFLYIFYGIYSKECRYIYDSIMEFKIKIRDTFSLMFFWHGNWTLCLAKKMLNSILMGLIGWKIWSSRYTPKFYHCIKKKKNLSKRSPFFVVQPKIYIYVINFVSKPFFNLFRFEVNVRSGEEATLLPKNMPYLT